MAAHIWQSIKLKSGLLGDHKSTEVKFRIYAALQPFISAGCVLLHHPPISATPNTRPSLTTHQSLSHQTRDHLWPLTNLCYTKHSSISDHPPISAIPNTCPSLTTHQSLLHQTLVHLWPLTNLCHTKHSSISDHSPISVTPNTRLSLPSICHNPLHHPAQLHVQHVPIHLLQILPAPPPNSASKLCTHSPNPQYVSIPS